MHKLSCKKKRRSLLSSCRRGEVSPARTFSPIKLRDLAHGWPVPRALT